MQPFYQELVPVIVEKIKPIRIREDTIEYHAQAFIVHDGAELEELLKKFPGMYVSADGVVTVHGKSIGRLRINGKDFSGDILTGIRNIPADLIDIVQVIDDYGDKAKLLGVKSGESEKVLNVILKKDKKDGGFGKFELGGGNADKYNAAFFSDVIRDNRQMTLNAWLNNQSPAGNINEKRDLHIIQQYLA